MENSSICKSIKRFRGLMQKYPDAFMMAGAMTIHACSLARLAALSAAMDYNKGRLTKYLIQLELKKPFLQKTYELFGKAV